LAPQIGLSYDRLDEALGRVRESGDFSDGVLLEEPESQDIGVTLCALIG
jgi:hypothetical protein